MGDLSAVVGNLLNTISSFIAEEEKLLGGFQREMKRIRIIFPQIKAFLEVVDLNGDDDPRFQVLNGLVRRVADNIRDVFDEHKRLSAPHHQQGFLGCLHSHLFSSVRNYPARRQLATRLQSINDELEAISKDHSTYGPENPKFPKRLPTSKGRRYNKDFSDEPGLHPRVNLLVGIEGPKEHLVSQLLEGASQRKVVAVYGVGGIGKTTLVKAVFDVAQVKNHFQICVGFSISRTYDFPGILKGLLQMLHASFNKSGPPSMESMDVDQLIAQIHNFLQQARYLVVLDNVQKKQFWEKIKFAFPENKFGGNRVMMTTSVVAVASASCRESDAYLFKLDPLSPECSWALFCHKTFHGKSCPANLERVVRGIVEKCGGLPFAILAIGGVMASKDLSRKVDWELMYETLEDAFQGTEELDKAEVFHLIYEDLPSNLQECLLYMSIYPEGYYAHCNDIMQLWLAEGFVQHEAG